MKVDVTATKTRLLDTGRKITPWAKKKGICAVTMRQYLNGRYVPQPNGEFETSAIKALKEDDLLVTMPEEKAA